MYNKAIIIGRLTADPELKKTQSSVSVISFTVALDRHAKEDKKTDFISCVAWRNTAEFICKYFSKGKPIGVEGSIQTRDYTDKEGNKRKAVEVVADNVFFVGGKSADVQKEAPDGYYTEAKKAPIDDYTELDVTDLPF